MWKNSIKGNERSNWVNRYVCTCILPNLVTRFLTTVGNMLALRYACKSEGFVGKGLISKVGFRRREGETGVAPE